MFSFIMYIQYYTMPQSFAFGSLDENHLLGGHVEDRGPELNRG